MGEAIMLHMDDSLAQARAAMLEVRVKRVEFDAPWSWLAAGWRDLWSVPRISLLYGVIFAALSAALAFGLMIASLASLVLALAGGFLLIGPMAAVGLYEISRRLEAGEQVSLRELLQPPPKALGQLAFFGAILTFVYLIWLLLAFLLLMLFLGNRGLPPPNEFVLTLLFTAHGLGLLVTGTAVGAVVAALVFAISAVSVPLLMMRRIDVVTAISASLAAVRANPKAMTLWASLIAGFMALGLATMFAGLVILFPLIGHATWHAYRDLVHEHADSYL